MSIYFEWTEKMSVGEAIIDKQHQKLLSQINKILDALVFGVNSKEVESEVKFFDEYINEHLSYEEEYMNKRGYPALASHKVWHQDFISTYTSLKKRFESNVKPSELAIDIERYLGDWWINHIGVEDKKYYLYFSK